MSDDQKKSSSDGDAIISGNTLKGEAGNANLVYILYLVGVVIPFLPLVGVVIAYVVKGNAAEWVQAHHRFQIRTFWIGLLYGLISFALTFVLIGVLGFIFTAVWYIIRSVKGMMAAGKGEPPANVETWLF